MAGWSADPLVLARLRMHVGDTVRIGVGQLRAARGADQ